MIRLAILFTFLFYSLGFTHSKYIFAQIKRDSVNLNNYSVSLNDYTDVELPLVLPDSSSMSGYLKRYKFKLNEDIVCLIEIEGGIYSDGQALITYSLEQKKPISRITVYFTKEDWSGLYGRFKHPKYKDVDRKSKSLNVPSFDLEYVVMTFSQINKDFTICNRKYIIKNCYAAADDYKKFSECIEYNLLEYDKKFKIEENGEITLLSRSKPKNFIGVPDSVSYGFKNINDTITPGGMSTRIKPKDICEASDQEKVDFNPRKKFKKYVGLFKPLRLPLSFDTLDKKVISQKALSDDMALNFVCEDKNYDCLWHTFFASHRKISYYPVGKFEVNDSVIATLICKFISEYEFEYLLTTYKNGEYRPLDQIIVFGKPHHDYLSNNVVLSVINEDLSINVEATSSFSGGMGIRGALPDFPGIDDYFTLTRELSEYKIENNGEIILKKQTEDDGFAKYDRSANNFKGYIYPVTPPVKPYRDR